MIPNCIIAAGYEMDDVSAIDLSEVFFVAEEDTGCRWSRLRERSTKPRYPSRRSSIDRVDQKQMELNCCRRAPTAPQRKQSITSISEEDMAELHASFHRSCDEARPMRRTLSTVSEETKEDSLPSKPRRRASVQRRQRGTRRTTMSAHAA
ncbi:expressed unknown protein [Seminavis robusta]|uniref:Uncharacterized protein n=1 Tax=Seminavis robusta TaxID=568900 RepID=A0A9N8HGM1_9STRA|nr:expressed unknown protein [Seminavis robusta]|eukprot:Sro405_g136020.1 n/a (150) ;mRNA; f:4858-5307